METLILTMLLQLAPAYGIDPHLAAAVAKTESRFNPKAVGGLGEVGLFQIRPEFSRFPKHKLFDVQTNIIAGLELLREAKLKCAHKLNKTFLVCYNAGLSGGKKIKRPELFPYYKKVYKHYLAYKDTNVTIH